VAVFAVRRDGRGDTGSILNELLTIHDSDGGLVG